MPAHSTCVCWAGGSWQGNAWAAHASCSSCCFLLLPGIWLGASVRIPARGWRCGWGAMQHLPHVCCPVRAVAGGHADCCYYCCSTCTTERGSYDPLWLMLLSTLLTFMNLQPCRCIRTVVAACHPCKQLLQMHTARAPLVGCASGQACQVAPMV
jgi:hypothetical protein